MSKLKISIALATYNGSRFLQEQLDSIDRQSRSPDELVVCDDQSSDDTLDILNRFREKSSFPVRVLRNEHRLGFAKNFEKAIGSCEGDLIFLCDQDDVWQETKLQKHEAIYDNEPDVGMVFNNARHIDGESHAIDMTHFHEIFSRNPHMCEVLQTDQAFTVIARRWRVCGCMTSFRARYWELITPVPAGLGHDDWLAVCMSLLSRIRVISEPLNDYRQHSAQVTKDTNQIDGMKGSEIPLFARLMEKRATELAQIKLRLMNLEAAGVPLRFPFHQEHLKGLMSHLWRRAAMSSKLSTRLPLVVTELLLNNYTRYNDNLRDCLSQDLRKGRFVR